MNWFASDEPVACLGELILDLSELGLSNWVLSGEPAGVRVNGLCLVNEQTSSGSG